MAIWTHETVFVEKDCAKREWRVYTPTVPHQILVTIPWVDAFRGYTRQQAPDYYEAIVTCRSNERTDLTEAEEDIALAMLEAEKNPKPAAVLATAAPEHAEGDYRAKVLSLDAHRNRKK